MITGATFSPCRTWRYELWRVWDPRRPAVMFVGLNPSTADETQDDPTVRRCIRFARDWGYGRLFMLNLFAYRSTDPKALKSCADPAGPENDHYLRTRSAEAALTVAAWGVHGAFRQRHRLVLPLLVNLHHLGLTKAGHPKHPLYLRADLRPIAWGRS